MKTLTAALVSPAENENLIFRGNTFATKAVDTYMKMVGETVSRSLYLELQMSSSIFAEIEDKIRGVIMASVCVCLLVNVSNVVMMT